MLMDVDERGINAIFPGLYRQQDVTGFDEIVQAALLTQEIMPDIIGDAVTAIERGGVAQFVFTCTGATHRSVGCALLLARLVYREASVVVTTNRTCQAGKASVMVQMT